MTRNCSKLRKCVQNDDIEIACERWYKEVNRILHQCFTKIKVTNMPPKKTLDYDIHQALMEGKILRELYSVAQEMSKSVLKIEIDAHEHKIAKLQSQKITKILSENKKLLQKDGTFSFSDAWKIKKKMFPRCSEPPFAISDRNGNLVTEYESILDVMKEEFTHRLRNRDINSDYLELKELKEYLCKPRLNMTKESHYSKWTIEELNSAIKRLRNNKCRDPHGHVNELYKNMGKDGLLSLLDIIEQDKRSTSHTRTSKSQQRINHIQRQRIQTRSDKPTRHIQTSNHQKHS